MSTIALIVLLAVIGGLSAAVLYLFVGPFLFGRFKPREQRAKEHRHRRLG